MPRAQPRTTSTHDVSPKARQGFDLDTLAKGGSDIEVIQPGKDFQQLVENEAFMHDLLEVRFHETGDPNAPKMIEVGVGIAGIDGSAGKDVRKAYMRGQIYQIPRFVVEVLAHAKVTSLVQKQGPSGRPDDIVNVEKHAFYYPFEVIRDPNPKGRAWLEKVLADPA